MEHEPTASGQPAPVSGGRLRAVVIGASAGGVELLHRILPQIPAAVPWFVALVQHTRRGSHALLRDTLDRACRLAVVEAEDGMRTAAGRLYLAPADYHLLIEPPGRLALSLDPPEHYCRPAIDPLFASAADCFADRLAGVILSGMGHDGAAGLRAIHARGGRCLVQEPASAAFPAMPEAALGAVPDAHRFTPDAFFATLAPMVNAAGTTRSTSCWSTTPRPT